MNSVDVESRDTSTNTTDLADIQTILAEELDRLPARFKAPIVLCDLEGTSHEEAAHFLGCPVGTVKSRLSRARARLRRGLIRRGLAPPDLSNIIPLFPAAVPRRLAEATNQAAQAWILGRLSTTQIISASVTALTEGVLWTMFLTKLKFAAAALLLIATGSAVLVSQATAQKPAARTRGPSRSRGHRRPRARLPFPTMRSTSKCSSAPGSTPSIAATRRLSAESSPTTSPASIRPERRVHQGDYLLDGPQRGLSRGTNRARRDQDPDVRRQRRRHQPDQAQDGAEMERVDECVHQAAGTMAMRGFASDLDPTGQTLQPSLTTNGQEETHDRKKSGRSSSCAFCKKSSPSAEALNALLREDLKQEHDERPARTISRRSSAPMPRCRPADNRHRCREVGR